MKDNFNYQKPKRKLLKKSTKEKIDNNINTQT